MHRPITIFCVLVILFNSLYFRASAQDYNITVNTSSPLTIREREVEIVECEVNATTENTTTLAWYDQSNNSLSYNNSGNVYQETVSDTEDYKKVKLYISGEVSNDNFEKTFTCQLINNVPNNVSVLETAELNVRINVDLKIANAAQLPPICQNDVAILTCLVRSYPTANSVLWESTVDDDYEKLENIQNRSGEVDVTIAIWNLQKSNIFTCSARNYDFYNETNNEKETFQVLVRNDTLDSISHTDEGFICRIQWNQTLKNYTTGYQITVTNNGVNTTIYISNREQMHYDWKMDNGDKIENISVALIMGDCIGPSMTSLGKTCWYKDPPEDQTLIIVISSVLGSIIVVLLIGFGICFCRIKKNSPSPLKDQTIPRAQKNNYNNHKLPRQPDYTQSTENHELSSPSHENRDFQPDKWEEPVNRHDSLLNETPQPVYDNVPQEQNRGIYEVSLRGNNQEYERPANRMHGQAHREENISSTPQDTYEVPQPKEEAIYENSEDRPGLPPRNDEFNYNKR